MDLGHWILEDNVKLEEETFGFIYCILNKLNGKKYFGKKQCSFKIRKKPLKGKKRVRISQKKSDWQTYTGSCKKLNDDIKEYGIENFTLKIIKACCSKSELMYNEAKILFDNEVLFSNLYYNDNIHCRLHKVKTVDVQ